MPAITFTLLWNVGLTTVLAILVGLLSRSKLLEHRPGLTHALWLLVLAKLITPPVIPLPVLPSQSAAMKEAGQTREPFDANFAGYERARIARARVEGDSLSVQPLEIKIPTRHPTWSIPSFAILVGVSSCGTLILIASGLVQVWRVSRTLRRATSDNVRLQRLARIAGSRLAMQGIPIVYAVDAPIAPFLWVRLTGPVIVLPTKLVDQLSDDQITCILCHELAHFVRLDHWSNTFAFLVAALFWWFPVAWWAKREMRAAQEVCCDGLALARGAATRRCYAETLFQVLEFVQATHPTEPALVCGFGGSSSMKRRFEMIASLNFTDQISWRATSFVIVCIIAMLCVPVPGRSQSAAEGGNSEIAIPLSGGSPAPQMGTGARASFSGRSQTAGAKAGALTEEEAARGATVVASDDHTPRMEASGRKSKDYRLAEKEADRLVAILKTCGRDEIYIWAFDRKRGTTSITASETDHQRIMALIQLLAKE